MTDDEFGELYERLRASVHTFAARRLGPEHAKDVVSETFLVVWEKRLEFPDDRDAWAAWTIGVARNKVLQELQRRRRKHHDQRFADDWLGSQGEPAVEDTTRTAVDSLHGRAVFASLTPAEQDLFGIAFITDLTPDDGAQLLGISTSAFTSRVSRLRQRLRDLAQETDSTDHVTSGQNR